MRITLYGLPCAGKTHILNNINFMEVIEGSKELLKMFPTFSFSSNVDKAIMRKKFALSLKDKDNFIVDGHYVFGDNVVFTNEDGNLYDVFLYLYIEPEVLCERIKHSTKNKQYSVENIIEWQLREIDGLREYCHNNNKYF